MKCGSRLYSRKHVSTLVSYPRLTHIVQDFFLIFHIKPLMAVRCWADTLLWAELWPVLLIHETCNLQCSSHTCCT